MARYSRLHLLKLVSIVLSKKALNESTDGFKFAKHWWNGWSGFFYTLTCAKISLN